LLNAEPYHPGNVFWPEHPPFGNGHCLFRFCLLDHPAGNLTWVDKCDSDVFIGYFFAE